MRGYEPEDMDVANLTDAMGTRMNHELTSSPRTVILALLVHLGIEVAAIENDDVRSSEAGPQSVHDR